MLHDLPGLMPRADCIEFKVTFMRRALGVFFLLNFFITFHTFAQQPNADVAIGSDYRMETVLDNLGNSSLFTFDFEGNFIVVENGGGFLRIVKVSSNNERTVLLERTSENITGISFYQGKVYLSSPGKISVLNHGQVSDIVTGLPGYGDYSNSPVIFQQGRMYFSVGTATNSGIIGSDNTWLKSRPSIHDLSCVSLKINQVNIETDNFLTAKKDDKAVTGSFMPYNTKTYSDTIAPSSRCNGVIMAANPDGSNLTVFASGLHNPKGISFDPNGKLFALDQGMEDRGVRKVKNGKDALFAIESGKWYGWPDFNAGEKLEKPLIAEYPNDLIRPQASFDMGHLSQFMVNQFAKNSGVAIYDNNKIVEFSLDSNSLKDIFTPSADFRISQIKFGPDNKLYILVNDGKKSKLLRIDASTHGTLSSTVIHKNLPLAWSLSLGITAMGLVASYLIYKKQQKVI
jgi:glucose/arabinose dehydrogenase